MRRTILIFVATIFLLNFSALSQNQTDSNGKKQGAWSKIYPNGKTMYEGVFKNDQPVGLFKHYYESGKLKIEQNYLSDDLSTVKMYENDGKSVAATGSYRGKKKEGEWKYYAENKLVQTENFKDGKKDGLSKVYSKTGAVLEEIPYKEDKVTGIRRHLLEDGKIYSEVSFKDNLEDGFYKLFEGNEKPLAEGFYVAGKKDGEWTFLDEKGNIVEIQYYKEGVLVNGKELKKKYEKSYDEREKSQGSYREPAELLDMP